MFEEDTLVDLLEGGKTQDVEVIGQRPLERIRIERVRNKLGEVRVLISQYERFSRAKSHVKIGWYISI